LALITAYQQPKSLTGKRRYFGETGGVMRKVCPVGRGWEEKRALAFESSFGRWLRDGGFTNFGPLL
jgi:hypothetical protein